MITVHKIKLSLVIQLISVLLLLLVPIQLSGDTIAPVNITEAAKEDWPKIISQLEDAYNRYPNNPEIKNSLANAYNNYALVLATQKKWSSAEKYLQQAVQTNPTNTAIKQNLSAVYFSHAYDLYQNYPQTSYSSSSYNTAKQLVNQAIAANANNAHAYILLGDIENANQNLAAAAKAWQRAAAIKPSIPGLQERLVRVSRDASAEANMNTKYNMFFIIKVDPEVEKLAGFDINEALDSTRIHVSNDLNYTQNIKIPVIVYTVDNYKESVPDAPSWSEGAFDGKIRIVLTKYKNNIALLKSTIVHEYTHAVIQDLTNGNIPRWFNEGIAKYMEYKYGLPPRINYLAQAFNSNNIIEWDKINDAIVSPNVNLAMLAYQQSFNFVYYMVQRYGMSKLRALLDLLGTNMAFDTAVLQTYGVPLTTIQRNWQLWLPDFIAQWAEAPVPAIPDA
jgi:tetratricopeptide (TPR) repeat protein